jgi:anti-sigma factor RsiW
MNRVDDVMLMAYVDGEVDAATAREIEASIAGDPALAARVQRLRDTAVMARSAFAEVLHEPLPDRLIAALGGPVRRDEPARSDGARGSTQDTNVVALQARRGAATPRRAIIGWAMAASLAALVIGYGAGTLRPTVTETAGGLENASSDRWLDNVAAYYNVFTNSLATKDKLLVDFNASDVPELEKWFGAKLNRKLEVPDLTAKGLTAQGGRLVIIGGKPAAQFLYTSDKGELVELVIAFTDAPYQPAQITHRGDVNIVHWRDNGYAYAFAGTTEPARLQEIADSVWKDLERAS